MDPYVYYQKLVNSRGVRIYIDALNPSNPRRAEAIYQAFSESACDFVLPSEQEEIKQMAMDGSRIIFDRHTKKILNALPSALRLKFEGKVYAGEFPTGDFNTHTARVPDGSGYIFLVNLGLMMLINTTAKIVMSQAQWADFGPEGNPITESVDGEPAMTNQEAGDYLKDMIKQYVTLGQWKPISRHKRIVIKGVFGLLQAMLTDYAELFVLAHEFGHAVLGHLDNEESYKLALPNPKESLSVIAKSRREELEADFVAGVLVTQDLPRMVSDKWEGLQVEMALAGPFLLFELGRLIDKVGKINVKTHPPYEERIQNLKDVFRRIVPDGRSYSFVDTVTATMHHLEGYL
jgi:hypothetical protein